MPGPRSAPGAMLNPQPRWPFWVSAPQRTSSTAETGPQSFVLTATDSVTLADAATRDLLALDRSAQTDALTLADSALRTVIVGRTVTDGIALGESLASQRGITRTVTDSLSLSEALARAAVALARTGQSDALHLSESLSRLASFARTSTDAVTLVENLVGVKGITRTTTDALHVAEALTRTAGHPRTGTDSVALAESVARLTHVAQVVTDALHLSDLATIPPTTPPNRWLDADPTGTGMDFDALLAGADGTPRRQGTDARPLALTFME